VENLKAEIGHQTCYPDCRNSDLYRTNYRYLQEISIHPSL